MTEANRKFQHRVLIVDDDDAFRTVLDKLLKSSGFATAEASTLEQAIDVLSSDLDISVILLDFWLGDVVGLDLLKHVQKYRPDTPTIFMSGGGGDLPLETVTALAELRGSEGFLYKPYSNKDLMARINSVLNLPD